MPSTPERSSDVVSSPMPIAYFREITAPSWSAFAEEGETGLERVAIITPRETSRTEIWPVRVSQPVYQEKMRQSVIGKY